MQTYYGALQILFVLYCIVLYMPSPGVRPSVTFVSCAETNKDIFEIFSLPGSQALLVFPHQTGWRCSDGNPLNGGVECKGVWKNDDFRPISRSIWETVIVRCAHSTRQFVSIEFSFHPYNMIHSVIAPGASPGEQKCGKIAILDLRIDLSIV